MSAQRRLWAAIGLTIALFLAWHEPWFVRPLAREEVEQAFAGRLGRAPIPDEEKAHLKAFFSSDDGRAFYNLNLMLLRDRAVYTDGVARPGVVTGADANTEYSKVVVPMLLQRGSYPVWVSSKIANLLMTADPGADFFQEIAIVRYRSRRDMLDMILDPHYLTGAPHKLASLEKNVALPMRGIFAVDASFLVPLLLVLLGLAGSALLWRNARRA